MNLPAALLEDSVPPSKVEFLEVQKVGLFDAHLAWSAPAQGAELADAAHYEVRFQSLSDAELMPWADAALLSIVTAKGPASELIRVHLKELEIGLKGLVAVRAIDSVGNFGEFSEPVSLGLAEPRVVADFDATMQQRVDFKGSWGVETIEGRGQCSATARAPIILITQI